MRSALVPLTLVSVLGLAACEFNLTDPNVPPPLGLHATQAQVAQAAVGLLFAYRVDVDNWVLKSAILGREGYRLDTADPRFESELLQGPLDPSNNAFGGGQWIREYRTIKSGYTILNAIDSAQISVPQIQATKGFVQTIQALSFLMILNAHTQDSIPIDVNRPITAPLARFVTNDSAYKHVLSLLDSADAHLRSAGATFPFDPGPGFTGFSTPAAFLQFNRAVAARVQAYRASPAAPGANCTACWDSVQTALDTSFADTTAALDLGVYNVYSAGNEDTPNPLAQDPASAIDLAHPFIHDSAELQNGSALLDKRFLAKIVPRGDTFPLSGLSSSWSWIRYPTPSSPIPIIRNEELILLRAEAYLGQGNPVLASQFINFIRVNSGGLAPIVNLAAQTPDSILTVLLKQRLYSLMYEGGHHWLDMRRYGRLNRLPKDRVGDVVFSTLPVNIFEVQARQ